MGLGKAPTQSVMFGSGTDFCEERLSEGSVYRLLHHECHRLFPDELFSDLFVHTGRRSVPPRILNLEQAIEFIRDDEYVEVTPVSIRLRKKILKSNQR